MLIKSRAVIKELLKKYHNIEIELLLAHVLMKPREFLYLHGENRLTRIQADRLTRMVKRRMAGEPVAYILGYKDFYGMRFKVNRDVLIPRPETEWVVEQVLAQMRNSPPLLRGGLGRGCVFGDDRNLSAPQMHSGHLPSKGRGLRGSPIKILDLGTGSGCIAISVAKNVKGDLYHLYASDISAKALIVAKQNAKMILGKKSNSLNYQTISFIQSDLLKNIKFNPDIIIANLPYGWGEWKNQASMETVGLKFEPKQALFTKEGGLYLYRLLLQQITAKKIKPKLIYLEFDPRQKQKLSALIKKILPGAEIKFHKDLNNFWRYAEVKA